MTKWYIIISVVISIFLFQNCGGMNSTESSVGLPSNNSNEENEFPQDDPNTVIFQAGEQLSLDKIPFDLSENDQARLATYMAQTNNRALLFTQDGWPVFHTMDLAADQTETNLKASERCELDQKRICSLFAAGNNILFDEDVFYSQFRSVLKQPNRQLNLAEVPAIPSGKIAQLGPYPDPNQAFTSLALGTLVFLSSWME